MRTERRYGWTAILCKRCRTVGTCHVRAPLEFSITDYGDYGPETPLHPQNLGLEIRIGETRIERNLAQLNVKSLLASDEFGDRKWNENSVRGLVVGVLNLARAGDANPFLHKSDAR